MLPEKAVCASCLNVAEQFRAKYPNVTVNIFDDQGVMWVHQGKLRDGRQSDLR
ncbi:hypothetical protein [Pseudomonas sp. FP453]|uniref:hypothetical protein n=1 Tax=Pseudomonas sp. FP453 TaxID=2954094 RepID=UPI00351EC95F